MARPHKDYKGQRFGRLVAVQYLGNPPRWECVCDCGTRTIVQRSNLTGGTTQSCGCLARELSSKRATLHGATRKGARTRGWDAWNSMMRRCYDTANLGYVNYGGRGITVCERWHEAAIFLADMGEPSKGLSLGRIDNERGYSPGNCRWETPTQQMNNTRVNVRLRFRGKTLTVTQWATVLGVPRQRLFKRLQYGWSIAEVLTQGKVVGRREKK